MKKLLVLLLALSLVMLCGCKNADQNDVVDPTAESNGTGSEITDPTENVTYDWETPIDIDDSFLQETEDEESTEPENEEDPTAAESSAGQNEPTQPNPTEPSPTEPEPDVTVSQPTGSTGSKPIELPMVPG